jgi:RNA polymerase-binding transcription factor DksA
MSVAIELVTQMKSIERALERAAKGTYGICSICGADIEKERLAAYLSAETCMDCA